MPTTPPPDPFPWHLGVYDAHCHPTDTPSQLAQIPHMKARALTIMATRAEDQSLVADAASTHGIKSSSTDPADWARGECIVPCFGWHPWFAHQVYFDTDDEYRSPDSNDKDKDNDSAPAPLTAEAKTTHYARILTPSRTPPSETDLQTYLSLPSPLPITPLLASLRTHLASHPHALVGEIGLDRSFRIPYPWTPSGLAERDTGLTPGGREGRRLTPYRCTPAHQRRVLEAQLGVAAEMGRAVSVHGVQAHGALFDVLKGTWAGAEREVVGKKERRRREREGGTSNSSSTDPAASTPSTHAPETKKPTPYPPRICLHSFSGPLETLRLYTHPSIPARIFTSFSTAVNLSSLASADDPTPAAFAALLRAVPDDMVLVESDLHVAGDEMDARLEDMVRRVCEVKGWGVEEGVRRLGRNWRRFVFGDV